MAETVVAVSPATAPRWASQSPPSMAPTPAAEVSQASPSAPRPNTASAKPGSSSRNGRPQTAIRVRIASIGPIPGWRAA